MTHSIAFLMQKFNSVMLRSLVNRFGVTYQGKVGDDIEVRVNGLVERFVKLVLLFKIRCAAIVS